MHLPSEKSLYVITGPTAVGKTELALRWAETHDAEIISCDSLLFYRGMDIGTAKPTPAEQARVPHHLIDVCAITEQMDVTRYVALARQAVAAIHQRGRRVLITGGSGFYLKAFFGPVADDIAVSAELRASITAQLETAGLASLIAELRTLNPLGLGKLDTDNPRRVTRALERCRASGRTLAELTDAFAAQPGPFADYDVRLARLERDPAELAHRVSLRVAAMLRDGLVAEVARLRSEGLEANLSASRAIGYRETLAMLAGTLPEENLAADIAQNTRALVKKQRTWFRMQLTAHSEIPAATAQVATLFAN